MIDTKLEQARQLIKEKDYDAARKILETIPEHPKAQEWLARLDEIAPRKRKNEPSDPFKDDPFADPFAVQRSYAGVRPGEVQVVRAPRDYTVMAIVILILYWVFWLPGLIVNVIMLSEANQVQRETGMAPEGKGCLTALLWFNVLPFLAFCCGIVFLFGVGSASEGIFSNIIEQLGTIEPTLPR
ncbi:hypothetical protein HC928_07145 [bacterium]|nr:hypothetical protein [bacterium]